MDEKSNDRETGASGGRRPMVREGRACVLTTSSIELALSSRIDENKSVSDLVVLLVVCVLKDFRLLGVDCGGSKSPHCIDDALVGEISIGEISPNESSFRRRFGVIGEDG